MTDSAASVAMDNVRDFVAPEHIAPIYEALGSVGDDCLCEFIALHMKKKSAMLLLSIFLGGFGAGRFYVGDYLIGGCRVAVSVIAAALSLIPVLGIIASIASFIWYIAECILTYRRVRVDNFETVMGFLAVNKKKMRRSPSAVVGG